MRATSAALSFVLVAILCSSCTVVELAGRVYKGAGQAATDYSKENKGFVSDVAGLGGKVSGAVGGVLVDASGEDKQQKPDTAASQPAGNPRTASPPVGSEAPSPATGPAAMSLRDAQQALAELGYQPGSADGVMGKKTVEALRRFQEAERLPQTAKLDSPTIAALRKAKGM